MSWEKYEEYISGDIEELAAKIETGLNLRLAAFPLEMVAMGEDRFIGFICQFLPGIELLETIVKR